MPTQRALQPQCHHTACGGRADPVCTYSGESTICKQLDKAWFLKDRIEIIRIVPWLEQVVFNAYRRDGPPSSPHWDEGFIEQIWYDDWETIGIKVKMARDKYHLGGVGLYQSTGGYPDGEDCDGCMWPVYQSIRSNFVGNGTSTAA